MLKVNLCGLLGACSVTSVVGVELLLGSSPHLGWPLVVTYSSMCMACSAICFALFCNVASSEAEKARGIIRGLRAFSLTALVLCGVGAVMLIGWPDSLPIRIWRECALGSVMALCAAYTAGGVLEHESGPW